MDECYLTARQWIKQYREVKNNKIFIRKEFLDREGNPVFDESGFPKTYKVYPESSTTKIADLQKYVTAYFSNWLNEFCARVHNSKKELSVQLNKGILTEKEYQFLLQNEVFYNQHFRNWSSMEGFLPFGKLYTHFNGNGKTYGISIGHFTKMACIDLDNKGKTRDDLKHTFEVHKIYMALLKYPDIFNKNYFWFNDEKADITGGHFWFLFDDSLPSCHVLKSLQKFLSDLKLDPKIELYPTEGSFIKKDGEYHPHNLRMFCGSQHLIPICQKNVPDIMQIYDYFIGKRKVKYPSWQQLKRDFPFIEIQKHYSKQYEKKYFNKNLIEKTENTKKDTFSIIFEGKEPWIEGKRMKGNMWKTIRDYFVGDEPQNEQINLIIRMVSQIMFFEDYSEDEIVNILYENFELVQPIRKAESSYYNGDYDSKIKRLHKNVQYAIEFKGCKNKEQSMELMELSAKYFRKNGRKIWDFESMKKPFIRIEPNNMPTLDYREYEWQNYEIPKWFDRLIENRVKNLLPVKQQGRCLEFSIKFAVSCSDHANKGFPYSRRHFQDFMAMNFSTISSETAKNLMVASEEIGLIHCYRTGRLNVNFYDIGKSASEMLRIERFAEIARRPKEDELRLWERKVIESVECLDVQILQLQAN